MADRWIWIPKWETYQHYKPNRERGPKWIKQETAQLADDRYLELSPKLRSVLHDLRISFATARQVLPNSTRTLSQLCAQRVMNCHLETLNHAGLIEFISRETLEQRLDLLYSRLEVEVEKKKAFTHNGGNPNPKKPTSGAFACPECGLERKTQQRLDEHLELVHNIGQPDLVPAANDDYPF